MDASPPRLADLERFLRAEGIAVVLEGDVLDGGPSIERVAGFENARQGDLGWVSPRRVAALNGSTFRGTALVASDGFVRPEGVAILRTPRPKLAFVRIAHEFFGDLFRDDFAAVSGHLAARANRISTQATVAPGVVIGTDVEIHAGAFIGPNTVLTRCSVGPRTRIGANCSIGLPGFGYERDETGMLWRFPHVGRVVIEADVEIGSCTCIDRGSLDDTVVRRGAKIDNLVHVAHNVDVGEDAAIIAHAMIGGSTRIGARSWIAPSAALMNQISIGAQATVGLGAVVVKSVPDGVVVAGNPARPMAPK